MRSYGQRAIGRSLHALLPDFTPHMLNVEAWRAAPHPNTVVVSTIRTALRERGMGVGELQRRLGDRGIRVSRGALDRLASDRPLEAVNFELLVPVLEELGITLREPFMALPSGEHEPLRRALALAVQTARRLAAGQTEAAEAAPIDEANEADADMADRFGALLRRWDPEVFDSRGGFGAVY